MSTQQPSEFEAPDARHYSLTRAAGFAPRARSPQAGGLLLAAAFVVLVGSLLPWVRIVQPHNPTVSFDVYQFGANGSINAYAFYVIIAIVLLALVGLQELGVGRASRWIGRTPLLAAVFSGVAVLRVEFSSWHLPADATLHRTVGGWVALVGVGVALWASVLSARASGTPSRPGGGTAPWPPPSGGQPSAGGTPPVVS